MFASQVLLAYVHVIYPLLESRTWTSQSTVVGNTGVVLKNAPPFSYFGRTALQTEIQTHSKCKYNVEKVPTRLKESEIK